MLSMEHCNVAKKQSYPGSIHVYVVSKDAELTLVEAVRID